MKRATTLLALGSMCVACASSPRVMRVYDGRVVAGAYVPPEAYAAYLNGALAEEAGDRQAALKAYERALDEDDEDPEVWTRVGDVRCQLDPKDSRADDAIAKALGIDPGYAPAFAARARCMTARGKAEDAETAAREASKHDPLNVGYGALVVRTSRAKPVARDRAVALTVAHGERVAAWDALVHFGRSHGDAELVARGLEGLVRVAPLRRAEVEKGALELLGQGFTGYAARVAAAIADVPQDHGGDGPRDPTLARLAVDEAILRDDEELTERRAVRGHVELSESAARALLLDRHDLAGRLAKTVTAADPRASGAHMVLAALAKASPREVPPATHPAPAACVLVLADAVAATSDAAVATSWLAHVERAPMAPHDPVVAPLAVDLAARGVLPASDLPLEPRIELAARRREPPPAIEPGSVDAKHVFLWHVLTNPAGRESEALYARLAGAVDRDAVVGFAVSRFLLSRAAPRTDAPQDWNDVRRAIAAAPAHPLLLAIAVELAKRAGKADELPPARARLMAVARTPAERALAAE